MSIESILDVYNSTAAHSIVLHGPGVRDAVVPGVLYGQYLRRQLVGKGFDVVAAYDVTGFAFPDDLSLIVHRERVERGELTDSDYEPMRLKAARAMGLLAPVTQSPVARSSPLASKMKDQDVEFPKEPGAALPLIDRLLRYKGSSDQGKPFRVAFIFDYAAVTFPRLDVPAPDIDLRAVYAAKWAVEPMWINGNYAPLILYVSPEREALHPALTGDGGRIAAIELPAPDYERRLEYIGRVRKIYPSARFEMEDQLLATHTAGLSCGKIEDMIVACDIKGQPISIDVVRERKREIMRDAYGGVLQVDTPRWGFERVAGHQEAKTYCTRNIIGPMREGNVRRTPKGIIFSGPPGTGKTMFAEALAFEAGINFAKLSIQNLMDKFVGASEKKLRRALDAIRSLTPCIAFLDEFDNALSNRDSVDTSQVNKNLLGMMLDFASEPSNRGKVLLVAATNRPDKIDAAMRRVGRFDVIMPFLPPNRETRLELLQIIARNLGCAWEEGVAFEDAADRTNGWTQAELEGLVRVAYAAADDDGHGDVLTQADLDSALEFTFPNTDQVEGWSALAIRLCNNYQLLPPEWRERVEKDDWPEPPVIADEGAPRTARGW